MASTMDESTPEVQTPSNGTPLSMMSLIWLTAVAGSHLVTTSLATVMSGILGEGLLEPVSRSVSAGWPAMPRM